MLDEGVDLPEVKVAIVIGGTASSRQAKQRLGRILRKRGQRPAVLYEIVCADTNEEHRSRRRRASDAYEEPPSQTGTMKSQAMLTREHAIAEYDFGPGRFLPTG